MKKDYTFKNRKALPFIYNSKIEDIVANYKDTLLTMSNIIINILGTNLFYLDSNEENENNNVYSLKASSMNKSVILDLRLDSVILKVDNKEYEFQIFLDQYKSYAILKSFTMTKKDRQVTQKIDSHMLYIEISFEKFAFSLEIPYTTDYYLDLNFLNSIKENSSIIELKKIYMAYFYPKQSEFEKRLATSLSKKTIQGEKSVVLDHLSITNGFVTNYLLSTIASDLILSIEGIPEKSDRTIKISNYNLPNEVDITREVEKLYILSRKLNLELK